MFDNIFGTKTTTPENFAAAIDPGEKTARQATAIGLANNLTGRELMVQQEMYNAMMRQKLNASMLAATPQMYVPTTGAAVRFNEHFNVVRIMNGWLVTFKGEQTFCQDTAAVSDFVAAKLVEHQMMEGV